MAEKPVCPSTQIPDNEDTQKEDNIRCLNMLGHFGFDCLAHQLVDKSVQQGFFFNILCVGETGIGKSTLIDTLFNTNLKDKKSSHFYSSVGLKIQTYELQENNVQLKLTVVKTVGYGDQINKEASYQPIVDYLDAQFESYLQEELKIKRSLGDYHDSRVHVCLYFISPTGHSLKSLDILTMKNIDSKVNIIPVIAKADAISKSDLQTFKCEIMNELISNGIQIYQFPTDDETTTHTNSSMKGLLPFAVVGSTDEVKVGKRTVRGRQYPWGILQGKNSETEQNLLIYPSLPHADYFCGAKPSIQNAEKFFEQKNFEQHGSINIVENENHCDFVKLRDMLLCTNMEDLKEQTHTRHYERYRRNRLHIMGFTDMGPNNQPVSFQEIYEAKRQELLEQCQSEEEELKQKFMQRVKEKETAFKEAEKELQDKFEHLKKVQQEETMRLEEERRQLEEEILAFYKMKASSGTLQGQVCTSIKKDKERKK